jgi:hypothetical protein
MDSVRIQPPDRTIAGIAVLVGATLLALVSARGHAGSWNDRSRLATVECLIDCHTLAIDDSSFADTFDKIKVGEHFYSDKSPLPALPMAAVYQVWQWATGGTTREQPRAFCLIMTWLFSGVPYVVAVWSVFQLGRPLGVSLAMRLALTASFALATVALTYAEFVNNHVLLLGVAAVLFLQLACLSVEGSSAAWTRIAWLGILAGVAYSIDLGTGPVLFVCAGATVAWRTRRTVPIAIFLATAMPAIVAHHALNYAVGGTFKPANANPEYFLYPGCPFDAQTMTGNLKHSVGSFLLYAASMLFGKRGFVGHNLPLFLAVPAVFALLWRRGRELPETLCALAWAGGTWMAYALTSNNSSGLCCSIRWFVPLLAPAYFLLTIFLRRWPQYLGDLIVLSAGGAMLSIIMWIHGPWIVRMVPWFWPIQAGTLLAWLMWRVYQWRTARQVADVSTPAPLPRAA